jgi:hypothetical protein
MKITNKYWSDPACKTLKDYIIANFNPGNSFPNYVEGDVDIDVSINPRSKIKAKVTMHNHITFVWKDSTPTVCKEGCSWAVFKLDGVEDTPMALENWFQKNFKAGELEHEFEYPEATVLDFKPRTSVPGMITCTPEIKTFQVPLLVLEGLI